jgi:DNA-binding protein
MSTPTPVTFTKPKDNKLHIHNKKAAGLFLNIFQKVYLPNFDTVELHALGSAITSAVTVADRIKRENIATVEKINVLTLDQ